MRRLRGWLGELGVLACFMASCGGTASSGTNGQAAVGATLGAVCTHLSDKADAACYVGRSMLKCNDGSCVSDFPQCGGSSNETCHNECEPSEYGLTCGYDEPVAPACRLVVGPIPGGHMYYCCKCD